MLYTVTITADRARALELQREACLLGDDLAEAVVWWVDTTGRIRIVDDGADGTVTIQAFINPQRHSQVWYAILAGATWPMVKDLILSAGGWALAQDALEEARILQAEHAEH